MIYRNTSNRLPSIMRTYYTKSTQSKILPFHWWNHPDSTNTMSRQERRKSKQDQYYLRPVTTIHIHSRITSEACANLVVKFNFLLRKNLRTQRPSPQKKRLPLSPAPADKKKRAKARSLKCTHVYGLSPPRQQRFLCPGARRKYLYYLGAPWARPSGGDGHAVADIFLHARLAELRRVPRRGPLRIQWRRGRNRSRRHACAGIITKPKVHVCARLRSILMKVGIYLATWYVNWYRRMRRRER